MKYAVTMKHMKLSNKVLARIKRHVQKLSVLFSEMEEDLPFLEIIVKKHKKRRLNHVTDEIRFDDTIETIESVSPKYHSPVYYDGTIKLILPRKSLVAHTKGFLPDQAIDKGFVRLMKEAKTYKGKHFTGNSEYFDHRSIRKINFSKAKNKIR